MFSSSDEKIYVHLENIKYKEEKKILAAKDGLFIC